MSQKLTELEALIQKIHPNQPTDIAPLQAAVDALRSDVATDKARIGDLETALTDALQALTASNVPVPESLQNAALPPKAEPAPEPAPEAAPEGDAANTEAGTAEGAAAGTEGAGT